jgi:hypothetical protein
MISPLAIGDIGKTTLLSTADKIQNNECRPGLYSILKQVYFYNYIGIKYFYFYWLLIINGRVKVWNQYEYQ